VATKKQPAEERPPFYDPAVHTAPDQLVYVELVCSCGRIWRQRDPVRFVQPQVRSWLARHVGDGHGPATKADAVAERERRRQAAFIAAGRERDYRPSEGLHLDLDDPTVRSWPVFEQTEA
jgi:hypothetical protein